jgi:hypothetical protein
MPVFAIITSGVVSNLIDAPADWAEGVNVTALDPKPAIGWAYADGEFIAPPVDPDSAPVEPAPTTTPYMTHFGFLSRLTQQERTAVRRATASDDVLDDAMFLFNSAERIDVTLPETQQLVGYLALTGLISPERIPALLAPIDVTSPHALL